MFKSENLLTLLCIFCFVACKAQNHTKKAIVSMQMDIKFPDKPIFSNIATFIVQNDFILEPIKVMYSNDTTDVETGVTTGSSSGERLKYYSLTNYREMIGMSFDIEEKIPAKSVEAYRLPGGHKLGIGFTDEPYINNGFSITDYSKDKDTVINGAKCFLIKSNKIVPSVVNGKVVDRILLFRLAINPALKSYNFSFISNRIIEHFGGGAIVYVDGVNESGPRINVHYTYADFTPVEQKLFDHYKALYDSNITLLDKFKKK